MVDWQPFLVLHFLANISKIICWNLVKFGILPSHDVRIIWYKYRPFLIQNGRLAAIFVFRVWPIYPKLFVEILWNLVYCLRMMSEIFGTNIDAFWLKMADWWPSLFFQILANISKTICRNVIKVGIFPNRDVQIRS